MIRAVLATDQAATSGVAFGLIDSGSLLGVHLGTTLRHAHYVETLEAAIKLAGGPGHLAVVMEDHSKIPARAGRNTRTILGMGAARGRWQAYLDMHGQPERLRFRVDMATWRGAVLGKQWVRADTESAKSEAVRWASAYTRIHEAEIDHNAAEALCILAWAAQAQPWRKS